MNQLRTIPFIPKRPVKVTERLSRRPRGKDNLVDRYAVAGGEGFVIAGQEDVRSEGGGGALLTC